LWSKEARGGNAGGSNGPDDEGSRKTRKKQRKNNRKIENGPRERYSEKGKKAIKAA